MPRKEPVTIILNHGMTIHSFDTKQQAKDYLFYLLDGFTHGYIKDGIKYKVLHTPEELEEVENALDNLIGDIDINKTLIKSIRI